MPRLIKPEKQFLTPSEILVDWLESEIDEALYDTFDVHPNRFYASSIGKDARILFFEYLGLIEDPIDPDLARKLLSGTHLHNRWAEEFAKANIIVAQEEDVEPPEALSIGGRLDFKIRSKKHNDLPLFLVELKTTTPDHWAALAEPDYNALCQWAYYSWQENVSYGYIIYESMINTGGRAWNWRAKYFQIRRIGKTVDVFLKGKHISTWPDLVGKIFDKLFYVLWCVENGAIPERCVGCALYGCKYPNLCGKYQKTVTFEQWKSQR